VKLSSSRGVEIQFSIASLRRALCIAPLGARQGRLERGNGGTRYRPGGLQSALSPLVGSGGDHEPNDRSDREGGYQGRKVKLAHIRQAEEWPQSTRLSPLDPLNLFCLMQSPVNQKILTRQGKAAP